MATANGEVNLSRTGFPGQPPKTPRLRRRVNLEQILKRRLRIEIDPELGVVKTQPEPEKPKFAFYDYLGEANLLPTPDVEAVNKRREPEPTEVKENDVEVTSPTEVEEKQQEKVDCYTRQYHLLDETTRKSLECPACQLPMRPPIYKCLQGHSVCLACKPILSLCPKCPEKITGMRNIRLEIACLTVQVKCEECGQQVVAVNMEAHLLECNKSWVDL